MFGEIPFEIFQTNETQNFHRAFCFCSSLWCSSVGKLNFIAGLSFSTVNVPGEFKLSKKIKLFYLSLWLKVFTNLFSSNPVHWNRKSFVSQCFYSFEKYFQIKSEIIFHYVRLRNFTRFVVKVQHICSSVLIAQKSAQSTQQIAEQ